LTQTRFAEPTESAVDGSDCPWPEEPALDASAAFSCDRCLLTGWDGGVLMVRACGIICVISGMVAALEWDEPARLRLMGSVGRDDVGCRVRVGVALDLLPEWMWNR
jgi:hypothetical protein